VVVGEEEAMMETVDYRRFHRGILVALPFACLFWVICLTLVILATRCAAPTHADNHALATQPMPVSPIYIPLVMNGYTPPSWKKGVGVCAGCTCEDLGQMNVSHTRSWAWQSVQECPGMQATANVWTAASVYQAIAAGFIAGGQDVFTFNETDMPDQSNLTPAEAVAPFHDLITAFPDRTFGTPSQYASRSWLPEFWDLYEGEYGAFPPNVGFVDVHCYFDNVELCIEHIGVFIQFAQDHGIDRVVVSEFSFGHRNDLTGRTDAESAVEAKRLMDWMDSQPTISEYDWFAGFVPEDEPWYPSGWGRPNLLAGPGGAPTVYGEMYAR
jgi:hypothetical protein